MNVEIITIGNEVITGHIVDTNAAFLADTLFSLGAKITRIVSVGDEVVIFGRQGKGEITVYEVAERSNTIAYEVTCGIGKRVPRVYIEDGRITGIVTLIGERLPREGAFH